MGPTETRRHPQRWARQRHGDLLKGGPNRDTETSSKVGPTETRRILKGGPNKDTETSSKVGPTETRRRPQRWAQQRHGDLLKGGPSRDTETSSKVMMMMMIWALGRRTSSKVSPTETQRRPQRWAQQRHGDVLKGGPNRDTETSSKVGVQSREISSERCWLERRARQRGWQLNEGTLNSSVEEN